MGRPTHRGTHAGGRGGRLTRPVTLTVLAALALLLVVSATLLAVRALGGGAAGTATTFTGEVTRFGDDGALLCVRRPGREAAEFCDVFYTPPDAPGIDVGDVVVVTTITSHGEDGAPVSGMLVEPVPE